MFERVKRLNPFLQQQLAEIIAEKIEVPPDFLITVTKVDCGADMKAAKVFISVLPFDKARDGLVFLIQQRQEIQRLLAPKLKTKFMPVLTFVLDETEETASRIYEVLDDLDK
ncbi:30S ribosome-binding factor RbfA [Candidatus Falkowbacteria bacterium]|nr:30S ribosome-binding factor RbfA [Candidatus Falkowbacteria bacterium]